MSKWLNNLSSALDDLDANLTTTTTELSSNIPPPLDATDLTTLESLRSELTACDARNADLARELSSLNKTYLSTLHKLQNLESDVTSSASQRAIADALQSEVSGLREEKESWGSSVADLKAQARKVEIELQDERGRTERERQEHEAKVLRYEAQIVTLSSKSGPASPDPVAVPSPQPEVDDEKDALSLRCSHLAAQNATLNSDLSTLRQSSAVSLTQAQGELSSLRSNMAQQVRQINDLRTQLSAALSIPPPPRRPTHDHAAANKSLQSKVLSLTSELNSARSQQTLLQTRLNAAASELHSARRGGGTNAHNHERRRMPPLHLSGVPPSIPTTIDAWTSFLLNTLRVIPVSRLLFWPYLLSLHLYLFVLIWSKVSEFDRTHGDFGSYRHKEQV